MSERLRDLASLIRSKNAGPFELTVDVMFDNRDAYVRVRDSGVITRRLISELFHVDEAVVRLVNYDAGLAIKATMPRYVVSGDPGDGDVYGAQQYGPLVDIEVP